MNTYSCIQLVEKAKAFAQITLDDDYIVRDNKPDVVRVIYTKGDVLVEDTKVGNQVVYVTGRLYFTTLYQSDDENHRLESVSGEIPFQEKLVMDEVEEKDEVQINVQMEDLSVGIINSRKLVIRALLNMSGKILVEEEVNLACRASEDETYQQKTKEISVLCLEETKKDIVHMQKEMVLPSSRTNIGEIIFYQVDFRNERVTLQNDSMYIEIDAQIWILYRSEVTGEYECYETTVPISGEMECHHLVGDEIFWAKISCTQVEVDVRSDYDGENRMIGLEADFSVDAQLYREESCQLLEDAYALDKELHMEREDVSLHKLLVKNASKIRLLEQEKLEPRQERILQICGSSGSVSIDRVQKRETGVQVEGVLNVHIFYNTTEDSLPYAHGSSQIPFEQFVEVPGIGEHTMLWIKETIEQLQVNLLDNTEYEVKAIVEIDVLAMEKETVSNIIALQEEPMDMEAIQKQPGMVGYVRRSGEELWDIAKKYHAAPENMIELDGKVLVVKQVF